MCTMPHLQCFLYAYYLCCYNIQPSVSNYQTTYLLPNSRTYWKTKIGIQYVHFGRTIPMIMQLLHCTLCIVVQILQLKDGKVQNGAHRSTRDFLCTHFLYNSNNWNYIHFVAQEKTSEHSHQSSYCMVSHKMFTL